MSAQQINPSPCLKRLSEEGYHVVLQNGAVILNDIPYLKPDGTTALGRIYVALRLVNGCDAAMPSDHTVIFLGSYPCGHDGKPYTALVNSERSVCLDGVTLRGYYMSQKPQDTGRYIDWYDQLSTYAKLISGPAMAKDPSLSPNPGKVALTNPSEDVFCYPNNASARNGTAHLENKLAHLRIGIIGLGGTGSHVLDSISKTRLQEIHLFDDDTLETHNAYRGPGVIPVEELKISPLKVEYYGDLYGKLRRDIHIHPVKVSAENLDLVDCLDFVFLCVDASHAKLEIVQGLLSRNIPFVDTGIGAELNENKLTGIIRSTIVSPESPEAALRSVITEVSDNNLYATNIQVVELNSINACLAVMQFKIYYGFYSSRPGSKPNWVMPIGKDRPINMGVSTDTQNGKDVDNNAQVTKPEGGSDDEAA